MLIVGGEVDGQPGVDVRVVDGRIAEVAPGLTRQPGETRLDAAGGALIPGLHDHHLHLRALAAAPGSVLAGPPEVDDAATLMVRLRAAAGATPPGHWIRAVGYHESVAGSLDRAWLDAAVDQRPVRVQHRSGALWILNSLGLASVRAATTDQPGIERDEHGQPTGRLWRLDRWLADALPPASLAIAAVARQAASRGVTGFTDADPERTQADVDLLRSAADHGDLLQRMVLMSSAGLDLGPHTAPDELGRPPAPFSAGPRKLLLDDATLPPLDELADRCRAAHRQGEPVAVHCVTRLQLVATAAALAEAGPRAGDRIEHAGVVPPELRLELCRLGVTVVTQPNFVSERGDAYLREVDTDDVALLYPCASLQAAGIAVAAGTDAPFGDPDPWAAMRAAVHRRTRAGAVLGDDERIDARAALDLFLGHPDRPGTGRRIAPGAPADLCVLDRPLDAVHAALAADPDADGPASALNPVAVTLAAGSIIADNR